MGEIHRHLVEEFDRELAEAKSAWSLKEPQSGALVWSVQLRDLGDENYVLSARRHQDEKVSTSYLHDKTQSFVSQLLASVGLDDDPVEWVQENVASMLMLANDRLDSWSGREWAIDFEPNVWLPENSPRRVFMYVVAYGSARPAVFESYQDLEFGLGCRRGNLPRPITSNENAGGYRLRTGLGAVTGEIHRVDVLVSGSMRTQVMQPQAARGLPVEVAIFDTSGRASLLISGDQYLQKDGGVHFGRFDTEVILIEDAWSASTLQWAPGRPDWLSRPE